MGSTVKKEEARKDPKAHKEITRCRASQIRSGSDVRGKERQKEWSKEKIRVRIDDPSCTEVSKEEARKDPKAHKKITRGWASQVRSGTYARKRKKNKKNEAHPAKRQKTEQRPEIVFPPIQVLPNIEEAADAENKSTPAKKRRSGRLTGNAIKRKVTDRKKKPVKAPHKRRNKDTIESITNTHNSSSAGVNPERETETSKEPVQRRSERLRKRKAAPGIDTEKKKPAKRQKLNEPGEDEIVVAEVIDSDVVMAEVTHFDNDCIINASVPSVQPTIHHESHPENVSTSNHTSDSDAIVSVKQEDDGEHSIIPEKTENPVLDANEGNLQKVVEKLRGNSTAMQNCAYLAYDLIQYLRTGIMPTKPSSIKKSTCDLSHFDSIFQMEKKTVKHETAEPINVSVVTSMWVNRNSVIGSQLSLPPTNLYREVMDDDQNWTGCDLFLISVDNEKKINADKLKEAKDQGIPVLIKVKDQFRIYGDPAGDGNWKITSLDLEDDTLECEYLMLMTEDDEKKIDDNKLEMARKKGTPVLIKVLDRFIIYGDSDGKGNWKLTEIKTGDATLGNLPFDRKMKIINSSNPLFTPSLTGILKEGHAPTLNTLPFDEGILMRGNKLFTPSLVEVLKEGHAHWVSVEDLEQPVVDLDNTIVHGIKLDEINERLMAEGGLDRFVARTATGPGV